MTKYELVDNDIGGRAHLIKSMMRVLEEDGHQEMAEYYAEEAERAAKAHRHMNLVGEEIGNQGFHKGLAVVKWLVENGWTPPDFIQIREVEE